MNERAELLVQGILWLFGVVVAVLLVVVAALVLADVAGKLYNSIVNAPVTNRLPRPLVALIVAGAFLSLAYIVGDAMRGFGIKLVVPDE